jgi:hypothetical protein
MVAAGSGPRAGSRLVGAGTQARVLTLIAFHALIVTTSARS